MLRAQRFLLWGSQEQAFRFFFSFFWYCVYECENNYVCALQRSCVCLYFSKIFHRMIIPLKVEKTLLIPLCAEARDANQDLITAL